MRTLIQRELRNTAPVYVVALVAYFLAFASGMCMLPFGNPGYTIPIPFANTNTTWLAVVVGVLFAVVLGLRQATADLGTGTALFLLHRPIERQSLFLLKVGVGLAVFLIATAVPLLCFALRAAIPGFVAAPFRWSMLEGLALGFFAMTCVYLSALLSGLRQGRWFGTKLIPIVGAGMIATLAWLAALGIPLFGSLISLLIICLANVALIQSIVQLAATREYR